jgi:hypothetical protein
MRAQYLGSSGLSAMARSNTSSASSYWPAPPKTQRQHQHASSTREREGKLFKQDHYNKVLVSFPSIPPRLPIPAPPRPTDGPSAMCAEALWVRRSAASAGSLSARARSTCTSASRCWPSCSSSVP